MTTAAEDPYLGTCCWCARPTEGPQVDFCHDCRETEIDRRCFGRCYLCKDGDHDQCVGVPCRCSCPTPDQRAKAALRAQALAKLTLEEQRALGVG